MTDTDDTTDDAEAQAETTVTLTVPITDEYRAGMWRELVDEMGEDRARELLVENIAPEMTSLVTMLYDNREQIQGAMQQMPVEADDGE